MNLNPPPPYQCCYYYYHYSKYCTVQGLNTIYPAECNAPAAWSAASSTPPYLPSKALLPSFWSQIGKITKFQQNLPNSKPSVFTPCPHFCCLKNSLFSHFTPAAIKWRSQDGWLDPSPEVLSPAVINWNRWNKVILLKELLGRIFFFFLNLAEAWLKFSALPKALTLNLAPGCPDWLQKYAKLLAR